MADIDELRAEVDQLRIVVAELRALVEEQRATIEDLSAENAELKVRLGQNSSNSSKPPSSDGYAKPTRQERRATQRKAGKQPGAKGSHLARVPDPDEVIVHGTTGML